MVARGSSRASSRCATARASTSSPRSDRPWSGYAGLLSSGEDGHITTVAVDPACHRHQIGTRLHAHAGPPGLDWRGAKNLTLEVRVSNEGAQAMYRTFGFAPVGVRKGYYVETNEDAIVMWAHDIDTHRVRASASTPIETRAARPHHPGWAMP